MPLISIVIPVHNTEKYLEKCVSSVLAQTLTDIEIILVENCSDDLSYELCDRLAAENKNIKVLHLDVSGPSHARNEGIKLATGEYIGFIDSDDTIDPVMYEVMYGYAVRKCAEIVSCNLKHTGNVERFVFPETGHVSVLSATQAVMAVISERISSSACTKLFKRNVFIDHKFPEGKYFEDHDMIYKAISDVSVFVHIDSAFYHYFQNVDGICHTMSPMKRYHYFLADYGRVEFSSNNTFNTEERKFITGRQTQLCMAHFREFMWGGGAFSFPYELRDIRNKLGALRGKYGVLYHDRKALNKICFRWPVYYYTHFRKSRIDKHNAFSSPVECSLGVNVHEPKLAIVIPAYKGRFFRETLDSLACQKNRSFRVYIGDDCSPEDLYSIVKDYENVLDIIYRRFDENLGGIDLVSHWERCIAMVGQEEYVCVFSDDDIMMPEAVDSFFQNVASASEFDVMHFNIAIINSHSEIICVPNDYKPVLSVREFFRQLYDTHVIDARMPEFIFRTSALKKHGFIHFDMAYRTDNATVMSIAKGQGIYSIPGINVLWRDSGDNMSSSLSDGYVYKRVMASIEFFNWIEKFFKGKTPVRFKRRIKMYLNEILQLYPEKTLDQLKIYMSRFDYFRDSKWHYLAGLYWLRRMYRRKIKSSKEI